MRPLFSRLIGGESYANSTPKFTPRSTEYKKRISTPGTSAPDGSMGSGLMDASYIELGPPRNNHVDVSTDDPKFWDTKDGGIMKTHTFGTNITYKEATMSP